MHIVKHIVVHGGLVFWDPFQNFSSAPNFVEKMWPLHKNTLVKSIHIFAHAMTADLPWCKQNSDLIGSFQKIKIRAEVFYKLYLINPLWNGRENS